MILAQLLDVKGGSFCRKPHPLLTFKIRMMSDAKEFKFSLKVMINREKVNKTGVKAEKVGRRSSILLAEQGLSEDEEVSQRRSCRFRVLKDTNLNTARQIVWKICCQG